MQLELRSEPECSRGWLVQHSVDGVHVDTTIAGYLPTDQATERWLGVGGVMRRKYTHASSENYRLTALASSTSPDYNNRQDMSYGYDAVGHVTTLVDAVAGQTQSFTNTDGTPAYDALNRLLSAQASGGSYGVYTPVTYAYVANGNIANFEGAEFTYQDTAHKHAVTHLANTQETGTTPTAQPAHTGQRSRPQPEQ